MQVLQTWKAIELLGGKVRRIYNAIPIEGGKS